jgi:hypothetical protein
VVFHPRAVEDAVAIQAWWRENRPSAIELFERELESVVTAVARSPTLGALAKAEGELPVSDAR